MSKVRCYPLPQDRRRLADNHKLYGARKIRHALRREGEDAARRTVKRLTRALGIKGLGSSLKCDTDSPKGIGCCDGKTPQAPGRRGTWRDPGGTSAGIEPASDRLPSWEALGDRLQRRTNGCTASAALEGFSRQMKRLPVALRRSMTRDRGSETACHPELAPRTVTPNWRNA